LKQSTPEVEEVDGTPIRVATPAALYRMKKGTVRSQDHVDAAAHVNASAWKTRIDMPVQKFRSIEEMNKAPLPESQSCPNFGARAARPH
jgi:hypothetical protein